MIFACIMQWLRFRLQNMTRIWWMPWRWQRRNRRLQPSKQSKASEQVTWEALSCPNFVRAVKDDDIYKELKKCMFHSWSHYKISHFKCMNLLTNTPDRKASSLRTKMSVSATWLHPDVHLNSGSRINPWSPASGGTCSRALKPFWNHCDI